MWSNMQYKCIKTIERNFFFENEAVFRFNKEEWRKSNDISSIKMKYWVLLEI